VLAVVELRSNTMKQGVHKNLLPESVSSADHCFWFQGEITDWSMEAVLSARREEGIEQGSSSQAYTNFDKLLNDLVAKCEGETHVVIMSNGGFSGIHTRVVQLLKEKFNE